jgi:hypothetical protein
MQFIPFQVLKLYNLNNGDTLTLSMRDKSKESIVFAFKGENFSFKNMSLTAIQVEQMIFDYLVEHE